METTAHDFRTLIEAHQRMVFSIALRVTGDRWGAEEVAQDVFLELHRSVARLGGQEHVRFWLRRVSVHRATDWLRKKARQPESGAEEWVDETHRDSTAEAQGGALVALEAMLRTLPEALRVAVVLRYQEEMLPEEIATMLQQPVATVKSNLQRGLRMLRKKGEIVMKEYVR